MLRLRTFGSAALTDRDGRSVEAVLSQPKRLALLVYLAVARPAGAHRRDRLLSLFWPELDQERARDALNQALRFLRQSLGADVVVSRGPDEVGIDAQLLWCDAVAFRAALEASRPGEAMELYRGELLQGFFVEEGGGFEEWLERERSAFRDAAALAARRLADQHSADGALTLAISWGRRALELVPDDERALRRLLRLQEQAGDRAGGIRLYEEFAARLQKEYDCDPSPETMVLVQQLRTGKPLTPEKGASRPAAVAEGSFSDRYLIERKLGAGGMATVFLARDLKHDREVALKVLRPEIAQGLARERFVREIRIAGRLQHPNIVPLFDSGEANGQLYYVMPHVQGETLRERLTREGRLSIEEVVHILREVGGALAYAHERGVIHRDIKPENVLLIDRRAVLTDFGIARAAQLAHSSAEAFDPQLTQPGTSLGTPAYMAPEQATGDPNVDHRADLYAVGVLAYEMLVGRTPFVGSTAQALLTAQLTEVPVPLAQIRPEVPPWMNAVLMRCLAKTPVERPSSAETLLAALADHATGSIVALGPGRERGLEPVSRRPVWWRTILGKRIGLAAALLVLVGFGLVVRGIVQQGIGTPSAFPSTVDTSRYVVLPFKYESPVLASLQLEQFVRDGLSRWEGVSLVDRFQLVDALARKDTLRFTSEDARQVAMGLGAGRYIRGEVSSIGDSIRLHAGVYDALQGEVLADSTIRLGKSLNQADSIFALLADRLLLRGRGSVDRPGVPAATHSLPARQAYVNGQEAIQAWELARADSQFARATELDGQYTEAYLWLAQVRSWRALPPAQWNLAVERAAAGRTRLTNRDRVLADALLALAADNAPRACRLLAELTRDEPHDFAAWYGLGTCLRRDNLVVRDERSPSKWAFRSGYSSALSAYVKAFQLLPSIHRGLGAEGFEPVRALLKTSARYPRPGVAADSSEARFIALPSWSGDSLAFVPWPASDFLLSSPKTVPATLKLAVQHQRELFHQVASAWAANDPHSPLALEALAVSLAMLADPACLDTLKRAQSLTQEVTEKLRLSGAEVWMRLKLAIPADLPGLRKVRELADSLLAQHPHLEGPPKSLLVSLAVLTGRANLAATLARGVVPRTFWGVPPQISEFASPLLALSALGGPADRIELLVPEVQRAIAARLPTEEQEQAYVEWLVRPATLLFGPPPPSWFLSIQSRGDYLLDGLQAALRGDAATAQRILQRLARASSGFPPEDLALESVFPAAQLRIALHDSLGAVAALDRALTSLSRSAPQISGDPAAIGALVRASALRAELAQRLGDNASARRWAQVVTIFWSDSDAFLQPVVNRMRVLAGEGG